MKIKYLEKIILALIIGISSVCCSSVFAQQSASGSLGKSYKAPQLSSKDSWSMVILPDPQTYVKFGRNQPLLELMTSWISENIKPLNIRMVLCTGDLVEHNEYINPDGIVGNQPSKSQSESVSRAV